MLENHCVIDFMIINCSPGGYYRKPHSEQVTVGFIAVGTLPFRIGGDNKESNGLPNLLPVRIIAPLRFFLVPER